jgi:hypothetical protein
MLLSKIYSLPIYTGNMKIIVADDFVSAKQQFEIEVDDDMLKADALTIPVQFDNGYMDYIVMFKPSATIGTMAHEAKHLLNMIWEQHGIKLDIHNDEPECYYLEWLMSTIYDFFVESRLK